MPVEGLLDQGRRNFWRTKRGWIVVAGLNDRIDFDRVGVKFATITPGHYETPAAACAAVVAALEASDSTPVWACSYNSTSHQFTISTTAHAFTLLGNSGANFGRAFTIDMGYVPGVTGSATSHLAINQSHQSRHFLVIDLGTPLPVITMAALAEHNIGLDGPISVRLKANATNVWTAPTVDMDMTNLIDTVGDRVTPARLYFSDPNLRWLLLEVSDTYNADGFLELGVLWLSEYLQMVDLLERTVVNQPEDFTRVEHGPDGVLYVDFGRHRDRLTLIWRPVAGDDLDALRAFLAALKVGQAWILDLDTSRTATPLMVYYGSFLQRPNDSGITHEVAVITFEFVVAL